MSQSSPKFPKAVEEVSFEEILNDKKDKLKKALEVEELDESDPSVAILEVGAYYLGMQRHRLNKCLLSVMIDFSEGADLDNLARLYGLERKLIKKENKDVSPAIPAVYEEDDDLRKRILEAPRGFSVAGPRASYVYYGKLADDRVKDVSALSEEPMEVDIYVLSYEGNGTADANLVAKVQESLRADCFRPMGDKVVAHPCEVIEFSLDIDIAFKIGGIVEKPAIIDQISANLKNYFETEHKIGGLISLAAIYSGCYLEHVADVKINSPKENIRCSNKQAPFCVDIRISEGVSE